MPSIYTWEELALAEKAEEEAKQRLPDQIRKWYDKWIDPIFEADAGTWERQISDMIGKHLIHAVGKENTLALVAAFYDLNTSKLASIPRERFIARAGEIMAQELAKWTEALPPDEADYFRQLLAPQQEAFRICRALALYGLKENGVSIFPLSSHELGKRISIKDHEAGRILKKFPFTTCVKKGEQWQQGRKPLASVWRWIYPLEAIPTSGAEESACPF